MKFTMDTPNRFPNGTMEITVGVAQDNGDSYLQLAQAIEVVALSLP